MFHPTSILVASIGALLFGSLLPAQCAAPEWRSMGQRPDIAIQRNAATTWDPDGSGPSPERLVVAGVATWFSLSTLATWDGVSWETLQSTTDIGMSGGSPFVTGIYALTVWNGSLIAAGDFTTIGGVAANRVARWNGSSWEPLGGGLPDRVNVLASYNGDLIAGGRTLPPGGVFSGYVARWDGVAWQSLGVFDQDLVGTVSSMVELNGELIVGGHFFGIGGIVMGSIAKWNGSVWQALGPGASTWGVDRVAVYNGELIVAGSNLLNSGVVVAQNIARWDGVQFQPMGAFTGPAALPYVTFNGDLIASGSGGGFRWDGASWYPLGATPYSGGTVTTFGGELIAQVGALPGNGISRWDGVAWQPLGAAMNNTARALETFQGNLVAGGAFTSTSGGLGDRIARWDGATWQPMGTGFGASLVAGSIEAGSVEALTIFGNELVAAGFLMTTDGFPGSYVAKWNGSAWLPFATGPGSVISPYGVIATTVYNGELIIGGAFASAGGGIVNGIARWNGSAWQPLGSGMSFFSNPGTVRALTVFNGDLVAGGSFDVAGGVTVNGIGRWDGVSWHALGVGTDLWGVGTGEVMALAVENGQLIVGGNFTDAGGAPASNVARWNGTSWSALGAGVTGGEPYSVMSLAAIGGDVIAGGRFNTAGGVNVASIARWDGSSWSAMGAGLTGYPLPSSVQALAAFRGAVIAAGQFASSGVVNSPYIARWSSPMPMLAVSQPGGAGAGVQVRNAWLFPGHEYYNLASLDLAPGGPGTGPYGGLSYVDVSVLVSQLSMPVGTPPFHIVASGPSATHGPYLVPPGITFEAISVDATGGSLGCVSTALQYTTY